MPELTIRICGLTLRLSAEDRRFVESARKRYEPFETRGRPDLSLRLSIVPGRLRPFRSEPKVVWDGRSGRIERHDLELDLAPGLGRATVLRGLSPLDSLLRISLSFELSKRGGFLCHSAAVDGWLFPGLSGAGKSTLGNAAPKTRLLADELVGVREGRLWGTPFRGDFVAGKNPASHPLRAIVLLDRRGPRGVRPVPKAFALSRLLQCALYFSDDVRGGRRILEAAHRCVLRAGTYALGYDARTTGFAGVESMIREAIR